MSRVRSANGDYLRKSLQAVPGIQPPTVPEGSSHVYFFFPILVQPERAGFDVDAEVFRRGVKAALQAEGVPATEWQRVPVPGQTLFQEMRGYGRGCPWSCGSARPGTSYHTADYPVASDICRRRLVLGASTSSFGPPNGLQLMDRYAEAFHKVLVEHADELVDLAVRLPGSD